MTSSTTRWRPSMSKRTSAGGKTPTGPACPPTGLTSRYPGFTSLSFIQLIIWNSHYVVQMFVFFWGMDAREEEQKREERSRKERNNREEVSEFTPEETVCMFVSTVIWRSAADHTPSFLPLSLHPVWWSGEWESELCMIMLARRQMSCHSKQVNTHGASFMFFIAEMMHYFISLLFCDGILK